MIAFNSPIRPARISPRARTHCGCVRTMNASPTSTPARSRATINCFTSSTLSPIGFSHSTCFPASHALIAQGTCK